MDFTSSSGAAESEANLSSNSSRLSSHSDVVETDELKLIKLQEYKGQLLKQRADLLNQLSNIRVAEPKSVQLDDKLLLRLLRGNEASGKQSTTNKPLPSVLPSLDVAERKTFLLHGLQGVTISCEQERILLTQNDFEASFKADIKDETITSLQVEVNAFEIELEPLIRYSHENLNINIAVMGIIQFLRMKQLHKEMITKIVDEGSFIAKSDAVIQYRDLKISFRLYWNLPSPYPETLILTNKIQEVIDYFIFQYGIESGIIKYKSTIN